MKYALHNLCKFTQKDEKGSMYISAPMSPMESAKAIAKHFEIRMDGLCSVTFLESDIHQHLEGRFYTGYSTLILYSRYAKGDILIVFVDLGTQPYPICVYESSGDKLTIVESYPTMFESRLSDSELGELCKFALEKKGAILEPIITTPFTKNQAEA